MAYCVYTKLPTVYMRRPLDNEAVAGDIGQLVVGAVKVLQQLPVFFLRKRKAFRDGGADGLPKSEIVFEELHTQGFFGQKFFR